MPHLGCPWRTLGIVADLVAHEFLVLLVTDLRFQPSFQRFEIDLVLLARQGPDRRGWNDAQHAGELRSVTLAL